MTRFCKQFDGMQFYPDYKLPTQANQITGKLGTSNCVIKPIIKNFNIVGIRVEAQDNYTYYNKKLANKIFSLNGYPQTEGNRINND